MNRMAIFSIVLIVSIILGTMDFFFNGYNQTTNLQANVQNPTKINNNLITKIQQNETNLEITENKKTKTLFNKIDLTQIENIENAQEILFTKNKVNYFKLYTFEFNSTQNQINYLKLKDLFNELTETQPYLTINEVNNYGIGSFYFNNTQEESMARLMIFTSETIFGIEYSKTVNKESIDPLLSVLTTN